MDKPEYRSVGKSVRKKDSLQLLLGKPVYTEDIAPDALVVKLLRSPHANAMVKTIDTSKAKKVPGVVDVYTWEDVPDQRFSNAGQTYPETSPYDRLIIDRHVRFVGDVVAIVAGREREGGANRPFAHQGRNTSVLEPVLDFRTAKDNPVLVHPEDNWHIAVRPGRRQRAQPGGQPASDAGGDIEAVLADCDVVLERTYHTKAYNQAMMETFRTFTQLDRYGRLHVIIVHADCLPRPPHPVARARHPEKPHPRWRSRASAAASARNRRLVSEVYPAFVTWTHGKPGEDAFTPGRSRQIASTPPPRDGGYGYAVGANKDGRIRAHRWWTRFPTTGAYGEHGSDDGWPFRPQGHFPLRRRLEAFIVFPMMWFTPNHVSAGAYRGYGATQGMLCRGVLP